MTFNAGNMAYLYSYNQAGRVTGQRMHVVNGNALDFDAGCTWDNQGRMTSMVYPGGNTYSYQYDNMGRLGTMTSTCQPAQPGCPNGADGSPLTVGTATYNAIGQLSQLSYDNMVDSRSYNSLMQLARLTTVQSYATTVMDLQYNYPAQNNGRISPSVDGVVGETVNYTYDSMNRLATAGSTAGSWAQAYAYDGFGNLTGVNGASVYGVDPTTNRQGGTTYDANGLPTASGQSTYAWDVENRMVEQSTAGGAYIFWTYDPYGKRVQQQINTSILQSQLYFYGIAGQKLATLGCAKDANTGVFSCSVTSTNVYFGGKLIRSNGVTVATDRLGSVRGNAIGERMSYLPYGQERTSTVDGREKFGTYFRDGQGQDYADQRYYNQQGAFWTPDPGWHQHVRSHRSGKLESLRVCAGRSPEFYRSAGRGQAGSRYHCHTGQRQPVLLLLDNGQRSGEHHHAAVLQRCFRAWKTQGSSFGSNDESDLRQQDSAT